jgi:hypothetical protein
MTDRPLALARLTDAAVSDNGTEVQFRIEGTDGRTVDVACGHDQIEGLVHYLARLGQLSAARRDGVTPHQFGPTDKITVSPLETSDVGFMRDLEGDAAVLVVRMFGFDLGFSVTPHQLRALHGEIERMVPKSMLAPDDHHHHHDHDHDHDHGHGHDHQNHDEPP